MTFPEDENPLDNGPEPFEPAEDPSAEAAPEEQPDEPAQVVGRVPRFPLQPEAAPEFDFPRMDDDVAAFRRELDEFQFKSAAQNAESEPSIAVSQSQRRRRRTSRIVERPDASQLSDRLESIAHRASPTFDFFVFSFLSGCILGIGYILDAPAILLIGILVVPLLAPWVGAALSAATGENRFFGQTFGGFLTAVLMVFSLAALAGLASRIFQPLTASQAFLHARLWWPDLLLLVIGTVVLIISFIQSDEKPILASLMLAYEIYLPASAAGFGLGSGVQGLWPEAVLVFSIHLAISLITSLIIFFYMGFRPLEPKGYALTIGIVLIGLVVVAGFAGLGSLINVRGDQASATPAPISTPTISPALVLLTTPSPTLSLKPVPSPSAIPVRPSVTVTPTLDVTPGPTLLPTPIYGRVQSESGGVYVRIKPAGTTITTVENGYLVEILPDKPIILEGSTWIHVIIQTPNREINGWVLLNLITTATPFGSP